MLGCDAPSADGYRVVNKFPHDPQAYTQGLLYHDGYLYESTGLHGRSSLRKVELHSGRVVQLQPLDRRLFGEGLALVKGVFIQLTWQSRLALVYSSDGFAPLRILRYDSEGWGLTYDGRRLIMSDGSARLFFRDPASFALLGTVTVRDAGRPVRLLNELEYIEGEVWANVYRTDDIVRIDPADGKVTGRLNFAGLLTPEDRHGNEDVLNGIAYDPQARRVFITGKLYGHVYEIAVCPPAC